MLGPGFAGLRLDEIQSFVVLAKELHFGRAAARLYLSSGGLSRRITHLESALRTPLFLRTTRRVELTAEGEQLALVAQRLLEQLESLVASADSD